MAKTLHTHARRFLGVGLVGVTACHQAPPSDRVVPNDNRIAAGVLHDGALTLQLEAREAVWFPDGDQGPSLKLEMFAEVGRAAQNPGPLIRVPAGTTIRVSVRNALRDSVLVVHGLHTRPGAADDTIQVGPGAKREVSFSAGAPGTYFYWGTTTHQSVSDRSAIDSQLHGAFIVDSAGVVPAADRVFVLGGWIGPRESGELKVINGLSWPNTERFTFDVGDTVRWRWVNPTDSPHPLHLHGFYFDVASRGSWAADTIFAAADRQHVVTEMPLSGGTFTMTWIPTEPGNWLLHCHVPFHTSLFLSPKPVDLRQDPVPLDPMKDMVHGMRGMVLGISVRPGASTARRPEQVPGAREIRLIAQAAPKRFAGQLDEMAFVQQQGTVPPAADSVPSPSSLLVMRRGEPVRVTIVNHTRAPTGVHWHGIELPSYPDGVPGWSGMGSRVAPMIAPGDSFVAAFTPTRAGTFMYHAHSNEYFQINLGLYGALLVVDSSGYDPAHERIIILGGDGPGARPGRINGSVRPDTMRLTVGETYRFRLIDIVPDWTIRVRMARDDSTVSWKAVAKDGADLASHAQVMHAAAFIAGPGETMDFEYRPTAPGLMIFEIRPRSEDSWKTRLPIRVSP
jgi:FtsP/CotA-like multicopper oxidase with cupredoxin domain